jgi:hypothetical protein
VTGATGAAGKAGATGATGATGAAGSEHAYTASSRGGSAPQTLTLSAPAGQSYVAIGTAEVTADSLLHPPTCTLKFGSTVVQTFSYRFNPTPVEAVLQGAGSLASGSITFTCEGSGNSVANLGLTAYVVSAVN